MKRLVDTYSGLVMYLAWMVVGLEAIVVVHALDPFGRDLVLEVVVWGPVVGVCALLLYWYSRVSEQIAAERRAEEEHT